MKAALFPNSVAALLNIMHINARTVTNKLNYMTHSSAVSVWNYVYMAISYSFLLIDTHIGLWWISEKLQHSEVGENFFQTFAATHFSGYLKH